MTARADDLASARRGLRPNAVSICAWRASSRAPGCGTKCRPRSLLTRPGTEPPGILGRRGCHWRHRSQAWVFLLSGSAVDEGVAGMNRPDKRAPLHTIQQRPEVETSRCTSVSTHPTCAPCLIIVPSDGVRIRGFTGRGNRPPPECSGWVVFPAAGQPANGRRALASRAA
jgi:hypothetical protein